MASVGLDVAERRAGRRLTGGGPRFGSAAVLRPGVAVVLVNISTHAALVESDARLRPGAQTELQLSGSGTHVRIKGRIDRCQVVRLDPLRYRSVVVFDEDVDVGSGAGGSE